MTIRTALELATKKLEIISSTARLDAELLLAALLQISRVKLITEIDDQLEKPIQAEFERLIERRSKYEPVAYLTGHKEFWGLDFEVTPAVLIPRPDTEILVQRTIEVLNEYPDPIALLDLGTGSGAISVAVAHELKALGRNFSIAAVDQSSEALAVAERNIRRHGFELDIALFGGSWFEALPLNSLFTTIVSNPPYIAEGAKQLSPETAWEPRSALFSGVAGFDAITEILKGAAAHLIPHGRILLEIGHDQREALFELWARGCSTGWLPKSTLRFVKDFAGHDRVAEISLATGLESD